MRKLLTAICLFSFAGTANATKWALVGETDSGFYFVDMDALVVDESVATIWLRTELKRKGKSGEAVTIEKWIHDCRMDRSKILAVTLYKSNGNVIGSGALPRYRQDWSAIVPGTAGDLVHRKVCTPISGFDKRRSEPIASDQTT